jgi:glycosyltransferase involved in cell wall biosynthesis
MDPDEAEKIELTVLMPCLNEAATLPICLGKAKQALIDLGINGEIIVADNGSTDGSQELARSMGAKVVNVPEPGYGSALLGGIEAAQGEFVIMGDADDSYDWSAISHFIEQLRKGNELVMGCRLPEGGGKIVPGAMPWLHRWIGNPILSCIGRLFFHSPITDFHCGLRGFARTAIKSLDLQSKGMEFASEMVIKATLSNLKIVEIPITLYPDGRSRKPHLRTWRDGWRHLRFMLMYSPTWLFLYPGLLFMCFGILGFALLLPGPLVLGSIRFDVNTLLVTSTCCIIGYQCVVFWTFARVFAMTEGFLPDDPLLKALFQHVKLETGLLIGLFFLLIGLTLLFSGFVYWGRHGFGMLSYPIGLRIVIPAVTMLTLGVQTIFSSFFLSLLGLNRNTRFRNNEYL